MKIKLSRTGSTLAMGLPFLCALAWLVTSRLSLIISRAYVNAASLHSASQTVIGLPLEDAVRLPVISRAIMFDETDTRAYYWLGIAYYGTGQEKKAATAWAEINLTGEQFTSCGNRALRAGDDNKALIWYSMALTLDPDWSDAWYHLGVMYYGSGDLAKAIDALHHAVSADNFSDVGDGDAYLNLGLAYEKSQEMNTALSMYTAAIVRRFTSDRLKAEAFYKRGEMLEKMGYDPRTYASDFQYALSLAPYHRWARLRLGVAIYQVYGDVAMAEEYIKSAITSWPDNDTLKWPYLYAEQVYYDAGITRKARYASLMALRVDAVNSVVSED